VDSRAWDRLGAIVRRGVVLYANVFLGGGDIA
jgi:hypothetical protein